MRTDILIAGSADKARSGVRLIGTAAILEGYAVRTGETIRIAQRADRWSAMSV